jgi:hypothetical protein
MQNLIKCYISQQWNQLKFYHDLEPWHLIKCLILNHDKILIDMILLFTSGTIVPA